MVEAARGERRLLSHAYSGGCVIRELHNKQDVITWRMQAGHAVFTVDEHPREMRRRGGGDPGIEGAREGQPCAEGGFGGMECSKESMGVGQGGGHWKHAQGMQGEGEM